MVIGEELVDHQVTIFKRTTIIIFGELQTLETDRMREMCSLAKGTRRNFGNSFAKSAASQTQINRYLVPL